MLMSSNKKGGERKYLFKHKYTQDGIMAWIEFLRDYDNNGSDEIRANKLESLINIKYSHRFPGGFLKYVDTLQANLNEIAILLPDQWNDN